MIAGWIDALSFTALGKVFTSFQSGNLIFLGLAVDEGDAELLVGAGVSLLAFLAGTALGAYVVGRPEVDVSAIRSLVPAFALQCTLLVVFAVGWQVFAQPAGNSAGVVTNAMTATLMLGGIVLGLRGRGKVQAEKASPVHVGMLVGLCGAYALSALIVGAIDKPEVTSLGPAALVSLAIAGLLSRDRELLSIGSTGRRTVSPNER